MAASRAAFFQKSAYSFVMLKEVTQSVKAKLRTKAGKNLLTFLAFLCLSAVLWAVLVLNEDIQRDVRCQVKVTHKPDSITIVSELPEAINVSVRTHGSQILKHKFTGEPCVDIDFRTFHRGNRISLGETELRGLVRTQFGSDAQVLSVTPDSINMYYTDRKPVMLPITIDAKITTATQYTLSHAPESATDSVLVYTVAPLASNITTVYTEPIRYDNLDHSEKIKVKLIAPPPLSRVEPSEIDVDIQVESLISKTRKVLVQVKNAPAGTNITTFPAMVEVTYMVPMGLYNEVLPEFLVEADYSGARKGSGKLPLQLTHVPDELRNVYITTDSVSFVIEQK